MCCQLVHTPAFPCLSQDVPLFIVDEMHLLGGPHGPALEVRCAAGWQLVSAEGSIDRLQEQRLLHAGAMATFCNLPCSSAP